ncbi:hypothetical protein IXO141_17090, partial [Xanthomonas oryzae pv. oryzae]
MSCKNTSRAAVRWTRTARSEPQWTRGTWRFEHRPRPPGGERSRFVSRSESISRAMYALAWSSHALR